MYALTVLTWYSLNFVANNVSIESAQKDFSYELRMKTDIKIGNKIKKINYAKYKYQDLSIVLFAVTTKGNVVPQN